WLRGRPSNLRLSPNHWGVFEGPTIRINDTEPDPLPKTHRTLLDRISSLTVRHTHSVERYTESGVWQLWISKDVAWLGSDVQDTDHDRHCGLQVQSRLRNHSHSNGHLSFLKGPRAKRVYVRKRGI